MLAKNIKYLRRKKKLSQQDLANDLHVARTTLGDYERGYTEPNVVTLIKLSELFDIHLDALMKTDLSLKELEIIRNKDFRVLAISVDNHDRSNIELVDTKAEAGYLESFQDPQYISELPKVYFPNMPQGTYRGFEVNGESMLPMEPGSIVICSYLEKLYYIKNNKTYVIVSKDLGVVYKRITNIPEEERLLLTSDNDVYAPYSIDYSDIAEIWEYYAHLSFSDAKVNLDNILEDRLIDIQKRVKDIQLHMEKSIS